MTFRKFRKNSKKNIFVDPDEIFLDSKNIQNFDRQQFEGRIEKPISKRNIAFLSVSFVLIIIIFGVRLADLQIKNGSVLRQRGENNILQKVNIFTERGIIYDRNKVELAWNKKTDTGTIDSSDVPTSPEDLSYIRTYASPGFSHLLGYVSYPAKDSTGNYWQTDFVGKDGLEKEYNDMLKGENGSKIIETDALGKIHSENITDIPKQGNDLVTSIDSRIQTELFTIIKNLSGSNNFTGGAGVMMDVNSGEVLTSTSFPEYNSETLSLGKDSNAIKGYLSDKRKPFLDRTISGLYTPGSIVKPFFGLGALVEGVIDQYKQILSTGSISIPNPYDPNQKTTFRDWRANGWTNMAEALAVSSDVYFYEIGGGFENQKGLGIANIGKYADLFGFDKKTGVDLPDEAQGNIPSPAWKAQNFKADPTWRIGDTYHTAIGQYGFQVTPMEMARAVAAIANYGKLLAPHFLLGDTAKENEFSMINLPKEDFDVIHGGMRQAVTTGTASALNVPYVDVAVKTGTAQILGNTKVNSWVIGFLPYEHPKYAFAVMMEAGPTTNNVNASTVMRQLLDWMSVNTPEYLK